jgi:F0F1-type ATP synthase delta subunit
MPKKPKTPLFANAKKRSLESIVGEKIYSVWVEMLKHLVPDGRTHRLSVVVAGMLQHASKIAHEKFGDQPEEGSVAASLLFADELGEEEAAAELSDLVEQLFDDAKVRYARKSSRGDEYSIIDSTVMEYIHWHDMPWE